MEISILVALGIPEVLALNHKVRQPVAEVDLPEINFEALARIARTRESRPSAAQFGTALSPAS
jgi:hypothetical protein